MAEFELRIGPKGPQLGSCSGDRNRSGTMPKMNTLYHNTSSIFSLQLKCKRTEIIIVVIIIVILVFIVGVVSIIIVIMVIWCKAFNCDLTLCACYRYCCTFIK